MKKIFQLHHPKIQAARLLDNARRDVKKYIKRERNKELPEGVDFWDFNCKFGPTTEEAQTIHVAEIGKYINLAEEQQLNSFYLEILAKPAKRTSKPSESVCDDLDSSPDTQE